MAEHGEVEVLVEESRPIWNASGLLVESEIKFVSRLKVPLKELTAVYLNPTPSWKNTRDIPIEELKTLLDSFRQANRVLTHKDHNPMPKEQRLLYY